VEEVDVGDLALGDQLGEVEHEALFHRPAGEAVEAAEGDGDEQRDQGDADPAPDRALGPPAQAAHAAEDEGGGVVGSR
jgi:hypothetical protein